MGFTSFIGEVVPSTVMVIMEGCTIGLTILASTVMAKGLSPFVFVVYTNAIGSIILLPYSFIYDRNTLKMPLLTLPFLLRVFFLGLIGVTMAQNLAFLGLRYSSPIVAIGMANLLPALSFLLALILRFFLKLKLFENNTHKFPKVIDDCSYFHLILLSQVGTVKIYPQVMKIVSFYSLFGTIQSAVLAAFIERDPTAWTLELNLELFVIILTAIFSSLIRSSVHMWCMRIKGPYFVPIFKPLGIPIASVFGCFLFADTFHYGSMMGAFVCGMGYYTVIWGQVREDDEFHNNRSSSDDKVPLLQEDSQV
ncbi:WAT1-related protein At1g70260-like [Olea europaea var. sylvestris]|uniref:WAT1-related protein At1g70260-like n=1 Tax=Olea europaea var. sylvestris TaxID=158386 RepID=UPI000C1D31F6|nr:WAT1-related protein At1g70260-like [Olea europaea var. sylvestris]